MSANNLIYEFKKRIYCSETNQEISKFDYLSDELKKILDNYFAEQNVIMNIPFILKNVYH